MVVTHVRLHRVRLDRIYQTKVSAAGGFGAGKTGSQYVILAFETDLGFVGLGEISDVEDDWQLHDFSDLQKWFDDVVVGQSVLHLYPLLQRVREGVNAVWHREFKQAVMHAVETALLDLTGRYYNAPVYALLGGFCRERLPISWVAYIRGTDLLEAEIKEKVTAGFTAFKLKVGEDFELDCDRIQTLCRLAGDGVYLKVDASGAWGVDEAIEKLNRMAELGVHAVETPIAGAARTLAKNHPEKVNDDPHTVAKDLAKVRQKTPVAVIEHVADFDDGFAVALVAHKAVDVFNVIPGQAGGLARSKRLIHLAEAGGIAAMLGSTVELGVGTAAALHLGVACPGIAISSDLIGPGLMVGDVVSPRFQYDNGCLALPKGAGLGVTLDSVLLDHYRC